ncbi:MAG: cytochrome c nitrite reductase small subunit [Anaerolineae bacterium]
MERLRPFEPALLILIGMISFVIGLSLFTFVRAEGHSYFSNDPSACVNCHVMRDQYDAWTHSSHGRVAACNDCHSPHDNIVNTYVAKGINGFNHSFAFTFNTYGEVIDITQFNVDIVNANCMYCHQDLVSVIAPDHDDAPNCITCHTGIGHPVRE